MSDRAPPNSLQTCASCAEQTDSNLWCARCHTPYCSSECQKAHWASGGHNKACKGLARARRDTNLEAQSRALARVSHMSGGAPNDARCLFCLDNGIDTLDPLMRGCACRGSYGWTHATCLVKMAEAAPAPTLGRLRYAPWISCSTCKQRFTGLVQLRLAIALWTKYARLVETDDERLAAAASYATALDAAGERAEAVRLKRDILDARTQTLGPEHYTTLDSACALAASLSQLGECAETAVLLQTTLAALIRTAGPDDKGTLVTESHLASALNSLEEHAKAEALSRGTLEKMRRVLGLDHTETLITAGNFATSLAGQGKYAEAARIEREVLVSTTRLLGAEHEETLISAFNLAISLSQCRRRGHKAEGQQLLRGTLALSLRALGPTHRFTQRVLQNMRALGLAR